MSGSYQTNDRSDSTQSGTDVGLSDYSGPKQFLGPDAFVVAPFGVGPNRSVMKSHADDVDADIAWVEHESHWYLFAPKDTDGGDWLENNKATYTYTESASQHSVEPIEYDDLCAYWSARS